jgi:hypothetical protein
MDAWLHFFWISIILAWVDVIDALVLLNTHVDPSRVAVLQRETARIREAQQTRLAQTQVPVKKKK